MSLRAFKSLQESEYIVGYTAYIDLIKELIKEKQVINTGMTQEVARCQKALDVASAGNIVSIVSSGDPGIYGMAGLVLELAAKLPEKQRPKVEVIPGISAVGMAASILGAPLMHDFVVISMSDLLTPWEKIKLRIDMAAQGDFVTAVYNPKSKKRIEQIDVLQKIMLKYRNPETPVGIVTNAARLEQTSVLTTLNKFTDEMINMFSLVIIGNSSTYVANGRMITPRGYDGKYDTCSGRNA